ncbi:MAG: LytTR family DNA-binding domain-containing protein [Bacteroidia bacterium]
MNILIIEDEPATARRLSRQIVQVAPEAQVLDVLDSVQGAVAWFQAHPQPDLVLMDVHLADGSGFDILEQIVVEAPIIFTTAYDEYALRAFKAQSVDYLLKPVKEDELAAALAKLARFRQAPAARPVDMETLARMIRGEVSPYQQRFLIRLPEQIKAFDVRDAAYFFLESRIAFMQLKNGKAYPIDYNMEQLEQRLHPSRFFRINRQFIVSYEAIAKMYTHTKSRIILELQPPTPHEAVVSSERSAAFKQWLQGIEEG